MKSTYITLAIITLGVVAVLYVTRPKAPPKSTANSSNALYASALTGLFSLGQSLLAPSKTPDLSSSAKAATDAVADGLPVSATQGNQLMTPSFLDGTGYVAENFDSDAGGMFA